MHVANSTRVVMLYRWNMSDHAQNIQHPSGTFLFSCDVVPLTWSRPHETLGSVPIRKLPLKEGDLVYSITQQDPQEPKNTTAHRDRRLLKPNSWGSKFLMKTVVFHTFEQFGPCCHSSHLLQYPRIKETSQYAPVQEAHL